MLEHLKWTENFFFIFKHEDGFSKIYEVNPTDKIRLASLLHVYTYILPALLINIKQSFQRMSFSGFF